MESDDRHKQTKKLIGVIFIFLIICILITVIILNINRENEPSPDDDTIETNSSAVEEAYINAETYASTNHPISTLLPIISDDSSYCISYDVSAIEDENYIFKLTIDYKTEEAKKSAEAILESPEFSTYNPSQYEIIYTKIND